jgi:hypothetical protein
MPKKTTENKARELRPAKEMRSEYRFDYTKALPNRFVQRPPAIVRPR